MPSSSENDESSLIDEHDTDEESESGVEIQVQLDPRPAPPVEFIIYKRRWYILLVFAFLACLQDLVWITFGPIDRAVIYAYGWSDATVAMMSNWATIVFIVSVIPLSWFFAKFGLRYTTIVSAFLVLIASLLRSVSRRESFFTKASHASSIINGISGVTFMSVPPALSVAWFPPSQRTTATATVMVLGTAGNVISYLLGPLCVPDKNIPINSTFLNDAFGNSSSKNEIRADLQLYLLGQTGFSLVLFLSILAFFPSKPPTPPSASELQERLLFKEGLIQLFRSKDVWCCTIAYALPGGVMSAYSSVLAINLKELGLDDSQIGFIGAVSIGCSCIAGVLAGYFSDLFKKKMKKTLITCLVLATLFSIWLALLCLKVLPFSTWQIYVSSIGLTSFNFACSPLFYEYTVEIAFPVQEALVGGLLATLNNFFAMIFLGIFFIPLNSSNWMNYFLIASSSLVIPLVAMTTEEYNRLNIDEDNESESDEQRSIDDSNNVI